MNEEMNQNGSQAEELRDLSSAQNEQIEQKDFNQNTDLCSESAPEMGADPDCDPDPNENGYPESTISSVPQKAGLPTWALIAIVVAVLAAVAVAIVLITGSKNNNGGEKEPDAVVRNRDLIDAIGGVSETYTGAVSKEQYSTPEETIEEFLSVEMIGDEEECTVVNSKSEGKLSQNEIQDMKLSAEDSQGIQSVEKFTVTYEIDEPSQTTGVALLSHTSDISGAKTAKASSQRQVVVIVISYGSYFKYFSPVVETGDTVTKSYYDSIFNKEKYQNCTFEDEMFLSEAFIYNGETHKTEETSTEIAKYDKNRIYLKQQEHTVSSGLIFGDMDKTDKNEFFIKTENGSTYCYLNEGDGWFSAPLHQIGFSSVEDIMPFANQYLDHTYFTKTSYGCTLGEENFTKYLEQAMAMDFSGDEMQLKSLEGSIDYFVHEGVLSGMVADITCTILASEGGETFEMTLVMKANRKCTNYGTTTFADPDVD